MQSIARTSRGLRVASRLLHQSASHTQSGSSSASATSSRAEPPTKPWYLDGEPPAATTQPAKGPIFTRYDPSATLPTPAEQLPLVPLPEDFPAYARDLHQFLTTNPLIVPSSVAAFSSARSRAASLEHNANELRAFLGSKKMWARRSGQDKGQTITVEGADVGANWNWILVLETQARGKGAVGRVERDIRKWLFYNPLLADRKDPSTRLPKLPGAPGDAEWSIFDVGHGICLNVLTAEGRSKWDLEELWGQP